MEMPLDCQMYSAVQSRGFNKNVKETDSCGYHDLSKFSLGGILSVSSNSPDFMLAEIF